MIKTNDFAITTTLKETLSELMYEEYITPYLFASEYNLHVNDVSNIFYKLENNGWLKSKGIVKKHLVYGSKLKVIYVKEIPRYELKKMEK
ncbi:MAG: hypothetical protein EOL97_15250 [Spirochaetia bacterium]|nr:hypothetical protein [Spirochaetia bacterium]